MPMLNSSHNADHTTNLLEFSIKSGKTSQLEDTIKLFILQLRTPIPSTGQPSVDATTGIVKIISATAVKCRFEEIVKDIFFQLFDASKSIIDEFQDSLIFFT